MKSVPLNRVELDVRSPQFYQNPYPQYLEWQEKHPSFYWENYGLTAFVGYREIDLILRDKRFGRSLVGVPLTHDENPSPSVLPFYRADQYSLLNLEPPDHSRIRSLVQRAFMSRQIERIAPRIATLAHELCDEMLKQISLHGQVDFKKHFATPIPVMIIADMLGIDSSAVSKLLHWSHQMVRMYEQARTVEIEEAAGRAAQEFMDYLEEVLAEKRNNAEDDLISHLLTVQIDDAALSDAEIISTIILLLNAGHEATVNVIGNGLVALLENPKELDLWRANLGSEKFNQTAVEEILRFDTPLHIFNRWVLQDASIDGQDLKRGDQISLILGAGNRDEAVFSKGSTLDLERTVNPHLSFGRGIHFCLGAPLARLELQVALPILLKRISDLSLAVAPTVSNTYHFRGYTEIIVGAQQPPTSYLL